MIWSAHFFSRVIIPRTRLRGLDFVAVIARVRSYGRALFWNFWASHNDSS